MTGRLGPVSCTCLTCQLNHVLELLRTGASITVRNLGSAPTRLVVVGGETMDGPRHIWWNFVSSRKERIEQAKADWRAARFDSVPSESEFIPLPEEPPKVVSYP